ncbi:MAG: glutathione S-transferase family protein [Pseudomonadota bacterium]
MSITLYYHPFSRAANVIWMLEEIETPYELRVVDIMKGEQKGPELLALNPMGKLPTLTDAGAVVTEGAAIALYLADRYSYGKLAPQVDDPLRAPYLRWSFFAPSVVEPGALARSAGWAYKESQAGWGGHAAMIAAMESALAGRAFLLGDHFSMADCVFGGTLRFMLMTKMLDATPAFTAYAERLAARPALQRADAKNNAMRETLGLNKA